MTTNLIFLKEASIGDGGKSLIMIVALIVIFYFFMIRPQSKKQKEIKKFRESLTKGSKIVTAGGIYGTIHEVGSTYFIVEITSNVHIRVDKNSVYQSSEDAAQVTGNK